MVHFCVFGGSEGQLDAGRAIYITVFGGAALRRPPFANQLAELRHAGQAPSWRYCFINLFGGASIKWPTLAEEYMALREAIRAGTIALGEWDAGVGRLGSAGALRTASLSLFGGLNSNDLPGEDEEIDALSIQGHSGSIPRPVLERLMLGVGQSGLQRLAAVRQAVTLALASGA